MTIRSCFNVVLVLLMFLSTMPASAVEHNVNAISGGPFFLRYCAGCHGFEGKANYKHAPQFSLGDRLLKDDRELLQSVLNGKKNIPPWKDKLPIQDLRNAIAYLRLMYERYENGEPPLQDGLPNMYYLFKPLGEQNMDWDMEKVNKQFINKWGHP